jgi:hypothetical protein
MCYAKTALLVGPLEGSRAGPKAAAAMTAAVI